MKEGVVAWLVAILIISVVLSIGCWFIASFVAGSNPDLGGAFLVLTLVSLIVFLGSGTLLILATWRT